jgi:hypothetical protein
MVLRDGGGGDNKIPGKSYRPFDILLEGQPDEGDCDSPVEERTLIGVPFLYSGPWQGRGSYHGLTHGITATGDLDSRQPCCGRWMAFMPATSSSPSSTGWTSRERSPRSAIPAAWASSSCLGLPDQVWWIEEKRSWKSVRLEDSDREVLDGRGELVDISVHMALEHDHLAHPANQDRLVSGRLWFPRTMADVCLVGYGAEEILWQLSRLLAFVGRGMSLGSLQRIAGMLR